MSSTAIETLKGDVWSVAESFDNIRADKSMNFEAEAGFAIQSLMGNEYAMKMAMQNRQSVVNAVTNIAAIGISLNPARKQAYLVPRDGRICLDISYMGLMDLALASGSIRWAQCALVFANDEFSLNGLDKQPSHKFNPFAKDRGELIGVYCVVKTQDGDYLTHAMTAEDVFAIRDRSSAWRAYVEKKKKCPWVTDEGEMVKKTCIKQAYKYWPKGEASGRLESAIHYLNNEAGEGLPKDPATTTTSIRGTDGAMESLSMEIQQVIGEMTDELDYTLGFDGIAACVDRVVNEKMGDDEMTALWSRLPSDFRTAYKAEKKARDEVLEMAK